MRIRTMCVCIYIFLVLLNTAYAYKHVYNSALKKIVRNIRTYAVLCTYIRAYNNVSLLEHQKLATGSNCILSY